MAEPLRGLPFGPIGPGPAETGMQGQAGPIEPLSPGTSFVDLLRSSINEVNDMQAMAENKVQKLVTGEISNIHEVMVATEEASIALNLLMQVRNQLLRAWSELKRTPV